MAEMIEQKLLQLLKEQFKSMELEINKIFDRAQENFRKARKDPVGSANQMVEKKIDEDIQTTKQEKSDEVSDPEDSVMKVISDSNIESPIPLPNPNLNTPPITPPNLNPSSQTINLNTEATPNLPSLSYPNVKTPANQAQSFQAINQNIDAFLNAHRPNPWPNKPPIHTNTREPIPWPNNPHVNTFNQTQTTEVMSQNLQRYKSRRAYQIQLLVISKSDDQPWTSPVAAKARIRAQPMLPTLDLFLLLYDFQYLKARKVPSIIVQENAKMIAQLLQWSNIESQPTASCTAAAIEAIKLLLAIYRNTWTSATISTSFPYEDRLRSRPERQLWDIPMADRALTLVQNRILTVTQLRNQVVAILRHLPEFDPGDQRSPEEEKGARWSFGRLGRNFEGNRRRIEVSGRRFGEKRRIGFYFMGIEDLVEEEARVLNVLIWGFSTIWGFYSRIGLSKKNLGISEINWEIWGFNPRDFGSSMRRELGIPEINIWKFLEERVEESKEDEEKVLGVILIEQLKDVDVVLMEGCREKEEDLCSENGVEMKKRSCTMGWSGENGAFICRVSSKRHRFEGDINWANWASWSIVANRVNQTWAIWATITIGFPFQVP